MAARKTFPPLEQRFWAKVNRDGPIPIHCAHLGPCWIWTASLTRTGYGRISAAEYGRTPAPATHVSWFLKYGEWPTEYMLHRCDNPRCVRPSHLFQGTQKENAQDREAKGRGNQPLNERNGKCKYSQEVVALCRALYSRGASAFGIGNLLRIPGGVVGQICAGNRRTEIDVSIPSEFLIGTFFNQIGRKKTASEAGQGNAQRTHCRNGHKYTPNNTRTWVDQRSVSKYYGRTYRQCLICYGHKVRGVA